MAFADIAPIADSLGITEMQANNYFSNLPSPPSPQPEPTLTKAKYVAVANKIYDGLDGIAKNGGIVQIARDVGLSTSQVRKIIKEMEKAYDAYQQSNP